MNEGDRGAMPERPGMPGEKDEDMMRTEIEILTAREVEEIYGLSIGWLANMRHRKIGPKYYKAGGGRKVVYKRSEVEQWLTAQPVLTRDSLDLQR